MTYDFTYTGEIDGRLLSVSWKNGRLTGDTEAVEQLEEMAADLGGELVGAPGWSETDSDHLSSPVSALLLMDHLFKGQGKISGTYPEHPDYPRCVRT
jgi:hypothetical protein